MRGSAMKDKYVADVGDFGKFGLLRAPCSLRGLPGSRLRLGVVWYRTPDGAASRDGEVLNYTHEDRRTEFRDCDPDLYDVLVQMVKAGRRSLKEVERSGILGLSTTHYARPLRYEAIQGRAERLETRSRWFRGALRAMEGCHVVFLDPDNGVAPTSVALHHRLAPKYVYDHELQAFIRRRQSLIVYHHLGRSGSGEEQVRNLLNRVRTLAPNVKATQALWFHRGTARVFFIVPTARHSGLLMKRSRFLLNGAWRAHFTRFE